MNENKCVKGITLGVDIDNTLTCKKIKLDEMTYDQAVEFMKTVEPRDGIDILNILCIKPSIVTYRSHEYRGVTFVWLNNASVPYSKLFTADSHKEFDFWEYIEYKKRTYIENGITHCIEDDIRVIHALEQQGIICSQVKGDENFEDAFWRLF